MSAVCRIIHRLILAICLTAITASASVTAHGADTNSPENAGLKKTYGPLVKIKTFSPEAVYLLTSLHPAKTVHDMIKEFQIEPYDDYLDRARAVRKKHLPAD